MNRIGVRNRKVTNEKVMAKYLATWPSSITSRTMTELKIITRKLVLLRVKN